MDTHEKKCCNESGFLKQKSFEQISMGLFLIGFFPEAKSDVEMLWDLAGSLGVRVKALAASF